MQRDAINPSHYRDHPSGVECITITEHMGFLLGNAVKYIWRAGQKGDYIEDLKKARWYLDREISNVEKKRAEHAPISSLADVQSRREQLWTQTCAAWRSAWRR